MILLYAFLLITIFLFYILYKGVFSFYLFGTLLLLPFILFIVQKIISRKVNVSFTDAIQSTNRKGQNMISLKIENKSVLPIANLMLEIEYFNCLDEHINKIKINTPVYGKNTQSLSLNVSSEHYGVIKFKIKKCCFSDMLKLFKTKLKCRSSNDNINEMKLIVIPQSIPLENNTLNYNAVDTDTNEYSKEKKGDDPSEIFDIREYMYGDNISRIHWKLSAKQNETMVKVHSLPVTDSVVLLVDLFFDKQNKNYLSLYDTLVETISTISYYLSYSKIVHKVVWYDNVKGEHVVMDIRDEEDHEIMIRALLECNLSESKNNLLVTYVNSDIKISCGHLIYISSYFGSESMDMLHDTNITTSTISYMHIAQDNISYPDNDLIDIINVKNGMVARTIQNIYL